jgi:hypothetical protein
MPQKTYGIQIQYPTPIPEYIQYTIYSPNTQTQIQYPYTKQKSKKYHRIIHNGHTNHPFEYPQPHPKTNLHSNYKKYPKNKMASAYRPRHKTNYKHNFPHDWKTKSTTSNYTKLHFIPKQIKNIIPTPPITHPTTKHTLNKLQKSNKKKPKILNPYKYHFTTPNTSSTHQKPHTITTSTPIINSYPPVHLDNQET